MGTESTSFVGSWQAADMVETQETLLNANQWQRKELKSLTPEIFFLILKLYSSCVLTGMMSIFLTMLVFVKNELEIGPFSLD